MATEGGLRTDAAVRRQRLKGMAFRAVLIAATLFGVLGLAALFVFIGIDAVAPFSAEPLWYLLYLVTVVVPTGGYALYVTGRLAPRLSPHPETRQVTTTAFAVAAGTIVGSLVVYAVVDALGAHDVVIYLAAGALPPLSIVAYQRRFGWSHLTGPAIPVSIPLGLGVAALLHDPLAAVLEVVVDWVLFLAILSVPVAVVLGLVAGRRLTARAGWLAAGGTLAAGCLGAVGGIVAGQDPALVLVLASGVLAPGAYVVADTLAHRRDGRWGLVGPLVLIGGLLVGVALEGALGLTGLDTWLTPTLLLESWASTVARDAGIYPQLVGSIIIVGAMALMAFPVGVGAAIYLEEYAPDTGPKARLATALDVNISNLAGVPSVVYGLLGLALFRNAFGLEPGLVIAAGATLGLLILPIVIVSAQEALRSVPDEIRLGSYGLGASRWQTIRNVVLPEAVPGILTGTILALGRAIGETAPLVMIGVATTRFSPPDGLFSGAAALPLQIFAAAGKNIPEYRTGVLAAASFVLLATMVAMNGVAILIRNRYEQT